MSEEIISEYLGWLEYWWERTHKACCRYGEPCDYALEAAVIEESNRVDEVTAWRRRRIPKISR